METRRLGKTDMEVSLLGFGASEIGLLGTPLKDVEELLGQALDSGLNVIDTAECYEESEEKIGKSIGHRRQDYYLFTKCGHASGFELPNWHPDLLELSIDRSLKRLKTDYLDLIQLHSCSRSAIMEEEVIAVLMRAKEKGKVRYIGYSGDSDSALFAVKSGKFDVLQTSISIADQEAITLTLPRARSKGMGIIAKRPIANVAWQWGNNPPPNAYHLPYWERLRQLNYWFLGKDDLNEAVETSLRFTIGIAGVSTVIVGTTMICRLNQNVAIVRKGALSRSEAATIQQRWRVESVDKNWVGL